VSDWYYNLVVFVCKPAFTISSSPIVLHRERIPHRGKVILAPTHFSEYDVPCLMAISRRNLDFVSIKELFRAPLMRWFFTNMNAFPLDRSRVDPATTRTILTRLEQGRAVVMFPEGRLRKPSESVLAGGEFKPALTRIARMSGAPILPCVILGTGAYQNPKAWLPLRQTRYAVNFGETFAVTEQMDDAQAAAELRRQWHQLHEELRHQRTFRSSVAGRLSRLLTSRHT
jgi:1-acyl-sn-glycerol-3-phosphate acyltransferase